MGSGVHFPIPGTSNSRRGMYCMAPSAISIFQPFVGILSTRLATGLYVEENSGMLPKRDCSLLPKAYGWITRRACSRTTGLRKTVLFESQSNKGGFGAGLGPVEATTSLHFICPPKLRPGGFVSLRCSRFTSCASRRVLRSRSAPIPARKACRVAIKLAALSASSRSRTESRFAAGSNSSLWTSRNVLQTYSK